MAKVGYEYWNPDDLYRLKENKTNWGNTDNQANKDVYNLNNQALRSAYGMTDADDISVNQLDRYIALAEQNRQKNQLLTNISQKTTVDPSVKQAADAIKNFTYDPNTDPAYKSYVDMYNRQGQSAAKQTLNNLNASNMGRNSSYSSAATAQVQQAYAQKASEMIPTLAQQAYEKLLNNYNITKDMSDTEYNRQLTAYQTLSDENTRRLTDEGLVYSNESARLNLEALPELLKQQIENGEIQNRIGQLQADGLSIENATSQLALEIQQAYGMETAKANLLASQLANQYTQKQINNYGRSGGSSGGGSYSKQQTMADADRNISRWLYSPYDENGTGFWKHLNEVSNTAYSAVDKFKDPEVYSNIIDSLIAAGYTYDSAKKKAEQYKTDITIEVMKREGGNWEDEDLLEERKAQLF